LLFLEHGSGVTVFQCEACGRSTIHRWTSAPIVTPPPSQSFQFPTWFTGVATPEKLTTF